MNDEEAAAAAEALRTHVEDAEPRAAALLAWELFNWAFETGRWADGRELVELALSVPGAPPAVRGPAVYGAGMLAFRQGSNDDARAHFDEALMLARESGDVPLQIRTLNGIARTRLRVHDFDGVRRHAEQALSLVAKVDDQSLRCIPVHMLAAAARMSGDYPRAISLYAENLDFNRGTGDLHWQCSELGNLAWIALHEGRLDDARWLFGESAALARQVESGYLLPYIPLQQSGLATHDARWEDAAVLVAAARAAFDATDAVPDPDDAAEYDRIVEQCRQALDHEPFEAAWKRGSALSLDEAIAFAGV